MFLEGTSLTGKSYSDGKYISGCEGLGEGVMCGESLFQVVMATQLLSRVKATELYPLKECKFYGLLYLNKVVTKTKTRGYNDESRGVGGGWVIPLLIMPCEGQAWLRSRAAPDGGKVPGVQASGHTEALLFLRGSGRKVPFLDSVSSRVIRGRF